MTIATNMTMARPPSRPTVRVSGADATPTTSDATTSGITVIRIALMKMVPRGSSTAGRSTDAELEPFVQALIGRQRNHERHRKQPVDRVTLPAEQELGLDFEKDRLPSERQREASAELHSGVHSSLHSCAESGAHPKTYRLRVTRRVVTALPLSSVRATRVAARVGVGIRVDSLFSWPYQRDRNPTKRCW